jgi:tetratricopeptide (TPR) repeat protein
MAVSADHRNDFFLSRRGAVAEIAREVADVLADSGYKVLVQDHDIAFGASFVEAMHEAIKNSRDLVILLTHDYESSPYTRKEFTSFEAERAQSCEERHIIVLRCEDIPLRGLLADNVYQDLVGVTDSDERRRRIIAAAEGRSQAQRPPPRPFIGVAPRLAAFTGRAESFDRLDQILLTEKPAAVTQAAGRAAVQGLGGVGKSSLASEYAHRYGALYAGVCWCPAESRTGLVTALAGLAVVLGAAKADEADIEKAARAALRRLAEQRGTWLLIYDNVTSPDEIADLLPAAGARVLITSRFSDWSGWAEEVPLDTLPAQEAVALLKKRAARDDETGALRLAEALGCLPLALDHAAAYCRRTGMGFADYAAKASGLIAAAQRGLAYPRTVAATFDLAIAEAVQQCPTAEVLMAYLSCCAAERIPIALIEGAVADDVKRFEAVAVLAEVSLVKHDAFEDGTPALTVHRLVQTVGRVRAQACGATPDAVERLIARLLTIYPDDAYSNLARWPHCAHVTPHLLALQAFKPEESVRAGDWASLLDRAGSYFHGRASYSEARPLKERALAIREKVLGPEHADTADSLSSLASLLRAQGELNSAKSLFKHALAIREKAFGPDDCRTATSLNNLAAVLRDQGELSAARPLQERALAICESVLGPDHPDTAVSLNNLAALLRDRGELVAARPLFERALTIREKLLGPDHPRTATSISNLAKLLSQLGETSKAEPLLQRAIAIGEKTLGSEHPLTQRFNSNYARLLLERKRLCDALQLSEAALAIHQAASGPNHPWTKDSARIAADALDALGRIEEARTLRKKYDLKNHDSTEL